MLTILTILFIIACSGTGGNYPINVYIIPPCVKFRSGIKFKSFFGERRSRSDEYITYTTNNYLIMNLMQILFFHAININNTESLTLAQKMSCFEH